MTYCPECGVQIAKDDVFCGVCGFRLNPAVPEISAVKPAIEEPEVPVAEVVAPVQMPLSVPPVNQSEISAVKDAPIIKDAPVKDILAAAKPAKRQTGELNFNTTQANFSLRTLDNMSGGTEIKPSLSPEIPAVMEKVVVPSIPSFEDDDFLPPPVDKAFPEPHPAPVEAPKVEQKVEPNPFEAMSFPPVVAPQNEKNSEQPPIPVAAGQPPIFNQFVAAPEKPKPVAQATPPEVKFQPQPENIINQPPVFVPPVFSEKPLSNQPINIGEKDIVEKPVALPVPSFESQPASSAPPLVPANSNDEKPRGTLSGNQGGTQGSGKASKLKPLDDGTNLNSRYEIVRRIGGGGMGAVYLASDRNLGGVLRAVKEMIQAYVDEEQQEKAIQDFRRESLLLTSLEHPSIPTIYDYFFDDRTGRFYLVMKYISGGDLAGRLRSMPEARLDEIFVTESAVQVADVLDYLHNRQPQPIVYRDLKPSNIMIDGNNGRAMLIDFGIARWVNKEEKGVTAVGTMGYAPPELFSGNADPRSDIYSLGATMFHLLTGADPQNNPLLIFDFSKNPRPRQLNQTLSVEMEKILMRAVEYNSDLRFQTAAEMRDLMIAHLQNLRLNKVTYSDYAQPPLAVANPQVAPLVFCGFCGGKIVATDMFCAYCGTRQPEAEKFIAATAVETVSKPTARLMIVGTNELDPPTYNLAKEDNLVGRRDPQSNIFPEVDLTRYDPSIKISRRHARIWRQGANYLIEDLGSSNGTMVRGGGNDDFKRLLPHQPHTLTTGDKVKVGETTLNFYAN